MWLVATILDSIDLDHGFESLLCPFLVLWSWESSLTCHSLNFLVHKIERIPDFSSYCDDSNRQSWKAQQPRACLAPHHGQWAEWLLLVLQSRQSVLCIRWEKHCRHCSVHVPSIPSTWAGLTATQFLLTTLPDSTISGPFHSVPFSGAEHDEGEVGSESAG